MVNTSDIYVFSNTKKADFREIVIPQNEDHLKRIKSYIASIASQFEVGRICLFAKYMEKTLYIGADLDVSFLEELSNRYFRVNRANGETKTHASVVFAVPGERGILLNKKVLSDTLRCAYTKKIWENEKFDDKPKHLRAEFDESNNLQLKAKLFCKTKYANIDEMFYAFNAEIERQAGKEKQINILFYYESDKNVIETYDGFRIKEET